MKKGAIFWFTGLSGAGKTTVANAVERKLKEDRYSVFIIDGDEVRKQFHCHLGFSREDIKKNNALIAKMCEKNRGRFDAVLVPIISPFTESREKAREYLGEGFYEIYFKASLDYLVRQDVKGLYAKAKQKIINDLIGFSKTGVAYEEPGNPDLIINSEEEDPKASIQLLYDFAVVRLSASARGKRN